MKLQALPLLLLLILPTVVAIGPLSPTGEKSCAHIEAQGSPTNLGQREWTVRTGTSTADGCNVVSAVDDFGSGSSLTLHCFEATFGSVPPPTATTLTISLLVDNSATVIRSFTPSGNSCTENSEDFTFYCTDTGAVGGSPRHGTVRIKITAINTGVSNPYNGDTDSGGTNIAFKSAGIFRCDPNVSALSQSNAQTTYVASDTIGTSYTADSAPYDTTNSGNAWVTCGTSSYNLGSDFPSSTARSKTATIIGPLSVWPDDCSNMQFGFTFTRNSAVTGFTSEPWVKWVGTPPAGVTFLSTANASLATSATLDRTITQTGSCSYQVNSTTTTTQFERLEGVTSGCGGWTDARGNALGNNVPLRGYLTRSIPPDVSDYTSTDFLSGGGGSTSFTKVSLITATPGTYHAGLQTFSTTARTEAVLLSIGNVTQTYTLTKDRHFTNILLAKLLPITANASTFTQEDLLYTSAQNLSNIRGDILSGVNVSCHRLYPNGMVEADVTMGLTNASGDTDFKQFSLDPPLGTYRMVCNSDAAGNYAEYRVTYFITTLFSGNTQVIIETYLEDNRTLRLGGGIHSITQGSSAVEEDLFDDPTDVHYKVLARQDDGYPFYKVGEGHLIQQQGNLFVYSGNVSLPTNFTRYIHIHVWGNFTGQTYLGTRMVESNGTHYGNFTGNFTIVTNGTVNGLISTAIDPYIPLLIWGCLVAIMFWLRAFVPAVGALIGFSANLFTPPLIPLPGAAMVFMLTFLLHILIFTDIFKSLSWSKR